MWYCFLPLHSSTSFFISYRHAYVTYDQSTVNEMLYQKAVREGAMWILDCHALLRRLRVDDAIAPSVHRARFFCIISRVRKILHM